MLSFDNISRVNQAVHDALAVEKCQTCGGYIGDYGPRYARHHDECNCQTCSEYHGLRDDWAGICRTCNGNGAQEAADARRDREEDR